MPYSESMQRWLAARSQQDGCLYEQYGKPLESDHDGEYVAISNEGRLILGEDKLAVVLQAADQFGPGKFALRRIGTSVDLHLRSVST